MIIANNRVSDPTKKCTITTKMTQSLLYYYWHNHYYTIIDTIIIILLLAQSLLYYYCIAMYMCIMRMYSVYTCICYNRCISGYIVQIHGCVSVCVCSSHPSNTNIFIHVHV